MTAAQQLADAEAAYHALMVGDKPAVVVDQNGERVEFTRASLSKLAGYIFDLKNRIAGRARPQSFTFSTSKGTHS